MNRCRRHRRRALATQVAGQVAKTLSYDSLGNITYKSDVGSYSYGADSGTGPGPHAVISAGGTTYSYDANGNNTSSSDGRTITYTTFDKAAIITKGAHTTTFAYGPDRARYKRTDTNGSGTKTTLYIGSVEKITQADGSKEIKRYIGGVAIMTLALDTSGATQSSNTHYLYKDHLGSLDIITDAAGTIIQEQSFDAWGQRRDAVHWQDLLSAQLTGFDHSVTTRGFTGHEMLDEVGIIHMNGRIYDPKLGRFLQADPFIQEPTNTQSLNRYSYGFNNPLNGVDPSGYGFLRKLVGILTHGILGEIFPQLQPLIHAYVCISGGPWACAASSFGNTYSNGGSFGDALKAGAISGVSAWAFGKAEGWAGIDPSATEGIRVGLNSFATVDQFAKLIAIHGLIGGVMSELQGGKFGHGFVSAGIVKATVRFQLGAYAIGDHGLAVVVAAITGGTVSELTGGKFANGAQTAAMQYAYNAAAGEIINAQEGRDTGLWAQTKAFVKGVITYPKDVIRTTVTGASVACEGFSTACAQNVENSRRIGGALYDYNNDPKVREQVDLANKLATQAVLNDPVIQSQVAGRAAVATIVGTRGAVGMGLNVMAITGGALRASEAGGNFVDASELVRGALGVDVE